MRFDAYAHHPYAGSPGLAPGAKPKNRRAITLGNIQNLIDEVTRLYGPKPIWITEYGYETSPPTASSASAGSGRPSTCARRIARRNPNIEMLLWFLSRDEARKTGWQSGFVSAGGRRKPSFYEFQQLAGATRRRQQDILRSARRTEVRGLQDLLRGSVVLRDSLEDALPAGPFLVGG